MTGTSRNVFQQRHILLDDIRRGRVAADTMRSKNAALSAQRKQIGGRLREAEMQVVLGTAGAADARDAHLEQLAKIQIEMESLQRGMDAASELVRVRKDQLRALYDQGFESFAKEAESATAGALTELREAVAAVGRAQRTWGKATALWGPLNAALRLRIQEVDGREGRIGDPASEAVVPPFPIPLPTGLDTAAPRPLGIPRLAELKRG